jgi:hypothetical protein
MNILQLINECKLFRLICNDKVTFVCTICQPYWTKEACYIQPTPEFVLHSYQDIVNHYYARHVTAVWKCCNFIPSNYRLEELSQHWAQHSAHRLACLKCVDAPQFSTLQAAIAHRRDHWQADFARIHRQVETQITFYTACGVPPPPQTPLNSMCMFCMTAIESTADVTTCCKQALHWECSVMWALKLRSERAAERCMHCQQPNTLTKRLQRRHTEFTWPLREYGRAFYRVRQSPDPPAPRRLPLGARARLEREVQARVAHNNRI